jgi:putative ubiquitin-RnfH superfamily antitoxin RatB of RatAB toxin-antitoxin module
MISIEVAYARPDRQLVIPLQVPSTCNAEQAIRLSGILTQFPEIDLLSAKIGIFGKPTLLVTTLRAGDRVEIYRPLQLDPKQARRLRAKTALAKNTR